MSKLLILGATGFIGSHLCLAAKGHDMDVVAAVRKESNLSFLQKNNIPYFNFQLNQVDLLHQQIINFKKEHPQLDSIIYNVGCTQSLNTKNYYQINFQYLKNFVKALQKADYFPKKFLFTSSLAVHQSQKGEAIQENAPFNPLTHYGKSKAEAEEFLSSVNEFPIIITRPTAVYGPNDLNFLPLIRSIKNHLEIYPSSPTQGLSLVYIDDLVNAYFAILNHDSLSGPYIISDGNNYTAKELNQTIKEILAVKTLEIKLPLTILKTMALLSEKKDKLSGKAGIFNRDKVKELTAISWHCDSNKLMNATGFRAEFNLKEGMQKTIQWYKQHGYI